MKMPPSNFSQDGLARLFSYGPNGNIETSQDNKTQPSPDKKIQAPPHTAHKQTAIIAGTIGGIVGLAIIVALGWYVLPDVLRDVLRPRKKPPPFNGPYYEKDGHANASREVVQPVELQAAALSEMPVQDGPLIVPDR